jgi:hypothetical protein
VQDFQQAARGILRPAMTNLATVLNRLLELLRGVSPTQQLAHEKREEDRE